MDLQERIDLMVRLGSYLKENGTEWMEKKRLAEARNPWFTEEFISRAVTNITNHFLDETLLKEWAAHYHIDNTIAPQKVGIVMAGNIPLVGFHDLLCTFIGGHRQMIKLSSKDEVLMKHIIEKMILWNAEVGEWIMIRDLLKGCDAYIATGGNQSARHFEQYFGNYPHIIRKSKTSVAMLTGIESPLELEKLADDVHLYFGRGCRNITKIFVPQGYDFVPLLAAFNKYSYFSDHTRYRNNYDFQLSLLLLNQMYYMTNGNTLLVENVQPFTPISVVHYEYYSSPGEPGEVLVEPENIQCIVGTQHIPFGKAQEPGLTDYADGIDTMQFLLSL